MIASQSGDGAHAVEEWHAGRALLRPARLVDELDRRQAVHRGADHREVRLVVDQPQREARKTSSSSASRTRIVPSRPLSPQVPNINPRAHGVKEAREDQGPGYPATCCSRQVVCIAATLATVLGVLYDIHGNLPALERVLAEADRLDIDRWLLGGLRHAEPMAGGDDRASARTVERDVDPRQRRALAP